MTVYGQEDRPGKDKWGYDLNPGCSWPHNLPSPSPSSTSYYSSDNGVTSDSNYSDRSSNSNGSSGLAIFFIPVLAFVGLGGFSALFSPKTNPSTSPQGSAPSVSGYPPSDASQNTKSTTESNYTVPQNSVSTPETVPANVKLRSPNPPDPFVPPASIPSTPDSLSTQNSPPITASPDPEPPPPPATDPATTELRSPNPPDPFVPPASIPSTPDSFSTQNSPPITASPDPEPPPPPATNPATTEFRSANPPDPSVPHESIIHSNTDSLSPQISSVQPSIDSSAESTSAVTDPANSQFSSVNSQNQFVSSESIPGTVAPSASKFDSAKPSINSPVPESTFIKPEFSSANIQRTSSVL